MYAEAYVENDVEHQDPVELVRLLYSKAIAKLGEALDHLEAGRIPERATAVAHASEVLLELQAALNMEAGGEIALNLARLYVYMQERLAEGNGRQTSEPLEECRSLLSTLLEGWRECESEVQIVTAPAGRAETQPMTDPRQAWTL